MVDLGLATRFRRKVSGMAMIASPLVGLASVLAGPESEEGAAEQLEAIAASQDGYLASVLLGVAALVLLIAAILGIAHPLRVRAVAFGNLGAGFAIAGTVALATLNGLGLALYEMAGAGLDREQMINLVERVEANPGFVAVLIGALVGLGLGLLLLTAAAARGGLAPRWVPAAVAAAIALGLFGHSKPIQIVFFVLLALALGRIGAKVLTLSDDAWESGQAAAAPEPPKPLPG